MTACIFCGGKADLLCDSKLGWERKRGAMEKEAPNLRTIRPENVPIRYRAIHTCDAPLCRACAVPDGIFHVRMKHRSFSESIDYCPGHDFGTLRREITGLQAQVMRAQWRAAARKTWKPVEAGQFGLFTELLT